MGVEVLLDPYNVTWFLISCSVNRGMSIEDFKFIYWMEYAHRMWGRGLGIMFALPFSYFLRKGYITVQLGLRLSALFGLGAGQGLIGWWMVKSGLEVRYGFSCRGFDWNLIKAMVFWNNSLSQEPASEYAQPRVSPYRLAAHLTSAFAIYCGLLWTGLSVVMPEPPSESLAWVRGAAKVKRLALLLSLLVGVTAVSGAFVAGNDAVCNFCFPSCLSQWIEWMICGFSWVRDYKYAYVWKFQGHAYNTFPKMGDTWIPEDVFDMKPLIRNFFENTSTVQVSFWPKNIFYFRFLRLNVAIC